MIKEIRFSVTDKQLEQIKVKSEDNGLRPSAYSRMLVIQSLKN